MGWGGPSLAPVAGRGPGVRRWCYERVCPAQVPDPYAPLGWLVGLEPPDPRFNKVVQDLCPGGDERLELPNKDFGCCGVRRGDHGEEPVRVDVLEVFPEGCHQLARGCGSVEAVERPQFRIVEGTRAPSLRWPGGWGGHGLPVLVRRGARRGALGWCQGVPLVHTPWRVPVAGASSRSWWRAAGHQTGEGRRSPSFLRLPLGRSRCVPVVATRPPRPGSLAVLQLGWGTPWCTGPVGRVVGSRVRDQCHRAQLAGGGCWRGLSPHSLRRPLVGHGLPWLRVRGVLSPRQRAGRRPWEGGGG